MVGSVSYRLPMSARANGVVLGITDVPAADVDVNAGPCLSNGQIASDILRYTNVVSSPFVRWKILPLLCVRLS